GDHRRRAGLALLATHPGIIGPQPIDEAAGRDADQPRLRVPRRAPGRPLPASRHHGLLHRVLGRVEVAVPAHERAEHARRAVAPDGLEGALVHASGPPPPIAGRSSITSPGWANVSAISSARSRLSTSTRKKPASCSFVSANGPSVATGASPCQR